MPRVPTAIPDAYIHLFSRISVPIGIAGRDVMYVRPLMGMLDVGRLVKYGLELYVGGMVTG